MNREDDTMTKMLDEQFKALGERIEKIGIAEYLQLLNNPLRLMYLNLLAGIARGVGMAIGFTVLAAVIIMILRELVVLNLPLIGGFIAEIVQIVNVQLNFPR